MAESEYKRCLRCRYILDHLPAPRCPECGLEFDPNQPETYWRPEPRRSALPYFIIACVGTLMMLPMYLYSVVLGEPLMSALHWAPPPNWLAATFALLLFSGCVLQWWMFLRGWYALVQGQRFHEPGLFMAALVISAIGGPGTCLLTVLGGP